MQINLKESGNFLVWLFIVILFSYFVPKAMIILATPFVYTPQTFTENYIEVSIFDIDEKVVMRANVSNQGGVALDTVLLNLTASNSTLIYEDESMTDTGETCAGAATCDIYELNYTLAGGDPPGTWIINVTANDTNNDIASNSTTFTVNVWVDILPSTQMDEGIFFGSVDPGTNDNPGSENSACASGTCYNISSDPATNVNLDFYHKSSGDLGTIKIENVTHQANITSSTGENLVASGSIQLTTSYVIIGADVCQNLEASINCWIRYWFDVPSGQSPGTVETTYYYCAVENGQGSGACS